MSLYEKTRWFFGELRRVKSGLAGFILLIILVATAVAYPLIGNMEDIENWYGHEAYWLNKMLPKLAPPAWVNSVSSAKMALTEDMMKNTHLRVIYLNLSNDEDMLTYLKNVDPATYNQTMQIINQITDPQQRQMILDRILSGLRNALLFRYIYIIEYNVTYNFNYDIEPKDIGAKFTIGPIPLDPTIRQGVQVYLTRPDGIVVPLVLDESLNGSIYNINNYADLGRRDQQVDIPSLLGIPVGTEKVSYNETQVLSCVTANLINVTAAEECYGNYTSQIPAIPENSTWFYFLTDSFTKARTMNQGLAIASLLQPLLEPLNLTVPPGKFIVPTSILFSQLGPGLLEGTEPRLKGTYVLTFRFLLRLPERVTFVREGIDTLNVTTVDFGSKMIQDKVYRLGTLAVRIGERENETLLETEFNGEPVTGEKTFTLGQATVTITASNTEVKVALGNDTIDFVLNSTTKQIDIYRNGQYLGSTDKKEYDLTLAGYDGTYQVPIKNDFVEIKKIRILGAYGILGTDDSRRDLWSGVLYGVRWALIIGLIVASISTTIGVIYGVIMGYYSGVISRAMMTIAQIVYSLPVLPLLIMLAYFMGRSIWNVVFLLIAFGWVGGVFTVRAMVLQIKEQLYITAAKAVGASNRRIIFRHVFPQVLPYMFASMALGVPGAILAEAGISFLGLGDPSIVTWGQILNEAQKANAVATGAWWWVLPPGLGIAIVGLTFVLVGHALDKILNPKLVR